MFVRDNVMNTLPQYKLLICRRQKSNSFVCLQGGTREIRHGRDNIGAEGLEDELREAGCGAEGEGGAGGEESHGTETGRGEETRRRDRLLEENKSTTQGEQTCDLFPVYPISGAEGMQQKPRRWTRLDTPLHVFPTLKGSFSTAHLEDNLGRRSLLLPLGFTSKVSHSILASLFY